MKVMATATAQTANLGSLSDFEAFIASRLTTYLASAITLEKSESLSYAVDHAKMPMQFKITISDITNEEDAKKILSSISKNKSLDMFAQNSIALSKSPKIVSGMVVFNIEVSYNVLINNI